jgi:exonuclease SbcC
LHTQQIVAAFAFSNGDIDRSYEDLYGGFKQYYAEQQGLWDALELAFVFCVRPDAPNLDRFCSNIETDVYFCRKFVVPLEQPLGLSLARLPFLPLTPLNGNSPRPVSAQSFLQQCGVPALLARFLVVQRERGPERIAQDCVAGEFGEARELMPATKLPVVPSGPSAGSVRLEAVTIKNFRAYRKPQTFTLGSDVTVLYGPNGFGKTSFFDAVDFAITGDIGRVNCSGEVHFKKTAQHLDSQSEESEVTLSFWCNRALRKIARTLADRRHPLLDGRRTDRKAVLDELTAANIPATDRIENFVRLFRATHLFNQERPELTKDFQDDCRLPSEIVARMLAFEDYANAISKAAKVRDVLEGIIERSSSDIRELSEQIAEERKELNRLGQTANAYANVEALETEVEALRAKLGPLGIDVAPQKPEPATLRGWRASLDARAAESASRSNRLSALSLEVAGLPQARGEVNALQRQVAEIERIVGSAEERRVAGEATLQHTEQDFNSLNHERAESQKVLETLEWVRATKPVYRQVIELQHAINDELTRIVEGLAQYRIDEEQATTNVRQQDALCAEAADQLKTKRAELADIRRCNESLRSWQASRARREAIVELEQAAMKSLESLQAGERDLAVRVSSVSAAEAQVARQVLQEEESRSEFQNLVLRLLSHVRSGVCPLCGENHGNKDELVRRIQSHIVADDATSSARTQRTELQEEAKKLAEETAEIARGRRLTEAQLRQLADERVRLDAELDALSNFALRLGITADPSGRMPVEQLQTRHARIQEEIVALNLRSNELGAAAEIARKVLDNTKARVASTLANTSERRTTLARLQKEVNRLRGDPRAIQFSLDIGDETLAEERRLAEVRVSELEAKTAKAQTEVLRRRSEVGALRQEAASLRSQSSSLRTQLAKVQKAVAEITVRLEEAKLPSDVSEQVLLRLINEATQAKEQFLSLRDAVSNVELAIEAATTSAALLQLRENVRNKEKLVENAAHLRAQHQPWLDYFRDLSRLASTQQNEAIASFTREYGPRTSVIQRRLRSVYGFDDIEIRSRDSEISVRVKRRGEDLRPTDYFSQSQQQTLFLGLFLTACISQTWSALSTVFLDDPVSHFDDLNTYAFLDLVVGLLGSGSGDHQFVISTCDEKLLQLARQKFRHFDNRAKFYLFSALGAEGPVVEEITTS